MSGFKLALRSEIVSLPPEKIRLTATAEPESNDLKKLNILARILNIRKLVRRRYDRAEFVSTGLSGNGCSGIVNK